MAAFGGVVLTCAVQSRKAVTVLPEAKHASGPNARALSRSAYRGLLVMHCLAGLVLLALLLAYFVGFGAGFGELVERLREKDELPDLTLFVCTSCPVPVAAIAIGPRHRRGSPLRAGPFAAKATLASGRVVQSSFGGPVHP